MWLIIRIIIGKSRGVEDTREIPKEQGEIANGKVVENGDLSATNHGKIGVCQIFVAAHIVNFFKQMNKIIQNYAKD